MADDPRPPREPTLEEAQAFERLVAMLANYVNDLLNTIKADAGVSPRVLATAAMRAAANYAVYAMSDCYARPMTDWERRAVLATFAALFVQMEQTASHDCPAIQPAPARTTQDHATEPPTDGIPPRRVLH